MTSFQNAWKIKSSCVLLLPNPHHSSCLVLYEEFGSFWECRASSSGWRDPLSPLYFYSFLFWWHKQYSGECLFIYCAQMHVLLPPSCHRHKLKGASRTLKHSTHAYGGYQIQCAMTQWGHRVGKRGRKGSRSAGWVGLEIILNGAGAGRQKDVLRRETRAAEKRWKAARVGWEAGYGLRFLTRPRGKEGRGGKRQRRNILCTTVWLEI